MVLLACVVFAFVVFVLSAVFILVPKGDKGEIAVTLMNKLFLDSKIYTDINNVTLLTPTGTTQIDHIIVSKFGVFVIETKNMSGWIFGDVDQAQWTQSFPGRSKFKFQNPLRQNYRHTKALEKFLGIDHQLIHSIVVFIGDAKFKTQMPPNVMRGDFIRHIKSKSRVLFSDAEVTKMVCAIRTGMMPKTAETKRIHIKSLTDRHS